MDTQFTTHLDITFSLYAKHVHYCGEKVVFLESGLLSAKAKECISKPHRVGSIWQVRCTRKSRIPVRALRRMIHQSSRIDELTMCVLLFNAFALTCRSGHLFLPERVICVFVFCIRIIWNFVWQGLQSSCWELHFSLRILECWLYLLSLSNLICLFVSL